MIAHYIVRPDKIIRESTIWIKRQARPGPVGKPHNVPRIAERVAKDNHVLEDQWITFHRLECSLSAGRLL